MPNKFLFGKADRLVEPTQDTQSQTASLREALCKEIQKAEPDMKVIRELGSKLKGLREQRFQSPPG